MVETRYTPSGGSARGAIPVRLVAALHRRPDPAGRLSPRARRYPRLYYLDDANFNVTAPGRTPTGAVVERYVYDAYGLATICDGPPGRSRLAPSTTVLYTGRDLDPETGLYFYRPATTTPAWGGSSAEIRLATGRDQPVRVCR